MRLVKSIAVTVSAAVILSVLLHGGRVLRAQEREPNATALPPVGQLEFWPEVKHDVSPPLRSMKPIPPRSSGRQVRVLGLIHPPRRYQAVRDPVRQTVPIPAQATTPGLSFAGLGAGDYGYTVTATPPDTEGAVGDTQYVQWINLAFAVFNKSSGALLYGPAAGNTLWQGFGGACESDDDGDPIAQFDKNAHRWVLGQFAVANGPPFYECIAVSATSDAAGQWYRYQLQSSLFDDYPKIAVWPDGYYMSFNDFNGGNFAGAAACAFNRTAMLAGQASSSVCFHTSANYGGLLPSDWDGSTPPSAGSPDFYLAFGTNSLQLWRFHVDFNTLSNSYFSGPLSIPVAAFSEACGGGTCIPQPNTADVVDSLADRLMYRLAYRHYADHESLVVNHAVGSPAGIRWYEIRNPGGTPQVYQQGTYAPDSNWRWMGSAAMDQVGDLVVGYSESNGTSLYPSIYYAGRVPSDASGTLEAETLVTTGTGSQIGSGRAGQRWGDYSAMTVDPADDCTFWYTDEYLKNNGDFNWSTQITSFKFNSCNGYQVSAGPAPSPINEGQSASVTVSTSPINGFSGTVNLAASGLPAGASANFNPTSIPASGSSTLTISTAGFTLGGTYNVVVTGTSGIISESAQTPLVIIGVPQANLSAAQLAFGTYLVGTASNPLSVTLANPGNGPLTIKSLSLSGDFGQANNCGTSVAALGSCQINVTFSPTAAYGRSGSLVISDNAASSPQVVNLFGIGTVVKVSAPALRFANQRVGTASAPRSFTLTNVGSSPLSITSIKPSSPFAATSNCPPQLSAGASCTINVTFLPRVVGEAIGYVTIEDNGGGGPQRVPLLGFGIP